MSHDTVAQDRQHRARRDPPEKIVVDQVTKQVRAYEVWRARGESEVACPSCGTAGKTRGISWAKTAGSSAG